MDIVGNRTLRDFLEERAERYGEKHCVEFEAADGDTVSLTYRELLEQVRSVAGGFADDGIRKGDGVIIHLPNCPEFLLTWFGLAWIGAIAIPSNTANTASELEHIFAHSGAVGVVTSPPFQGLLEKVADACAQQIHGRYMARVTHAPDGWTAVAQLVTRGAAPPPVHVEPEDVAELIFTSGTTALPKAVMLTHANLLYGGERESRGLMLGPTDRALTALPLFHVNAQSMTTLSTLTVGGTVLLLEEFRATRFWGQVRAMKATALSLVAMQVRTLLAQAESPTDRDHSIRRIVYAINVPDSEKAAFETRYGVELTNAYGLSEAFTLVTMAPVHGQKRWPSIGLPTMDRQVRIVDTDGHDVPTGETGQIIVHGVPGRTVMKGYFNDPAATEATLRDGWLYTGDNGFADEKGYLYFFDRLKDMIKTAGENVSASEVERVLLTHDNVIEAAVIGIPHPIRDEVVKAFVVARDQSTVTVDDLVDHCSKHLAKFKVPAHIDVVDALPKTSIGKIEKNLLRSNEEQGRG